MKVLSTNSGEQTFKVIPREYVTTLSMSITDDSTKDTTTYSSLIGTEINNHLQIGVTFNPVLKEGRFYDMVLKKEDNTIIYKDKIFCTNQDIASNQEYTVNSNEYTSDTSYDNDFIIL